jgi:hypothetical protein
MRDDDDTARAPQRIVEQSMLRVAHAKLEYIRAVNGVSDADADRLQRELHAEVLGYYLALKPYSWKDDIQSDWTSAKLWQTDDGWERGLDSLGQWINRKRERQGPSRRRGQTGDVELEPDTLPAEVLIRVSGILDDIARKLGIAISTSGGSRPAAMVPQITREEDEAAHEDLEAATDGGQADE